MRVKMRDSRRKLAWEMDFWKTKGGLKKTGRKAMKNVLGWMVVAMVNMTPRLKCYPVVFQEESDEFPVPCVEALLLCVNVLVRFLF